MSEPSLHLGQRHEQGMHTLTEPQMSIAQGSIKWVMMKAVAMRIKELLGREAGLREDVKAPEHMHGVTGHIARRVLLEYGKALSEIETCDSHPDHLRAGLVSVVEQTHARVDETFRRWREKAPTEYVPSIIDPAHQLPAVREYAELLETDFSTKTLPLFHTVRTAAYEAMTVHDLRGMEPGYDKSKRRPHTIEESYSIPFLRPKTLELLFDPAKGRDQFMDTTSKGVWVFDYFERQRSMDGKIDLPSVYESMHEGLAHPPVNPNLAVYEGRILRGGDSGILAWETHEQTPPTANSTQASRARKYMADGATRGKMHYHGTPPFEEFDKVVRQIQLFDTVVSHHAFAVDRLFALSFPEMYRRNPNLKYMIPFILHELHITPQIRGMRGQEPIRFSQNVKSKELWKGLGFDVVATDYNLYGPQSRRLVNGPEGEVNMLLNPEWGVYYAAMAKAVDAAQRRYRNTQLIHGDISQDFGERVRLIA